VTRAPVFRPQADQEVQSARQWYEDQQPGLGIQFANAIDEVLERISSNPLAFPAVQGEHVGPSSADSRTASTFASPRT